MAKTKPRSPKKKRAPRITAKSRRPKRVGKRGAPAPRKLGRPPILTAQMTTEIATTILAGNYIETAAAVHGIDRSTLYAWMKEGARLAREERETYDERETLLIDFSVTIKRALAESEAAIIAGIRAAGMLETHWQALAWLAERKWPDRFGRRTVVRVASPEESDARDDFDPTKLSTDELEQLDAIMCRAKTQEET